MKICMISYSYLEDDSRILRYATALVDRKYSVHVICLGDNNVSEFDSSSNLIVHRLQKRNFNEKSPFSYLKKMVLFFFKAFFVCTYLHLKNQFDIIHYHNIPDFGIFCTVIPKLMGVKVILDIHDLVPEYFMRKFNVVKTHFSIYLLKRIERLSTYYANHVITVTDIWRERLIERSVPADKCTVIMNVPDERWFYPRKDPIQKGNKSFLMSYHGNLGEPMGADILIRAMKIVTEKAPEIQLQILGQGLMEKALKRMVRKLTLENHIRFIKTVPVDKVPEYISRADIGIDPKRSGVYAGETLSVKAMEYIAMKIPLIIARTKTAARYFDNSMVRFFKPEDEEELAGCILDLYLHPEKRKTLNKHAERFRRDHSWKRYQNDYFGLIKHL